MLRLVHAQATSHGVRMGAILVDDIDDGLPNKPVHTMGSTGNPKAYKREGYAEAPKQACYIPKVKLPKTGDLYAALDASVAGYVDLRETERVVLSWKRGKIAKLAAAGFITVTQFNESALVTPAITGTSLVTDLTLTGTGFTSVSPDISSVIITGAGAVTLSSSQITAGGGTFAATSIVIPAALIPSVADGSVVKVRADGKVSNAMAVGKVPVITTAVLNTNLTITGTSLLSTSPLTSSVVVSGTGAVTLTRAQIIAAPGGAFTDTSITVPDSLITGVTDPGSSVKVVADGNDSNVQAIVATPHVTTAVLSSGTGNLTITGTFMDGSGGSVVVTGTGAATVAKATITGGGGTYTNTSVVILAASVPAGVVATTSSIAITADGLTSTPAVAVTAGA